EGAVWLRCPEALARDVAGFLFGRPPDEVEKDDLRDALGELANIIGGNLKALMSGVCRLGLPTTAVPPPPADARRYRVAFRCGGHVFVVETALAPSAAAKEAL